MIRERTASFLSGVLVASSIPFVGVAALAPPAHAATACSDAFVQAAPSLEDGNYVIASEQNLNYLLQQFNQIGFDSRSASFIQTRDLDMDGCSVQRGMGTEGDPFAGSYDGGGFDITNLIIEPQPVGAAHVGLFNFVDTSGSIENLGVSATVVNAYGIDTNTATGVLIGQLKNGDVTNCHSSGSVIGPRAVGGLIGEIADNTSTIDVRNSYSTAAVGATDASGGRVGGFVGQVVETPGQAIVIVDSYATGDVGLLTTDNATPSESTGGFVGRTFNGPEFRRSFASGDVKGTDDIGGFAGLHASAGGIYDSYATGAVTQTSGTNAGGFAGQGNNIVNSYSIGAVTGTANVGGFFGQSTSAVDSFWNRETTSQTDGEGDGTVNTYLFDKTTSEMQDIATFTTFLTDSGSLGAWDITSGYSGATWGICSTFNDGYPFLNALYSSDPCTSGGGGGGGGGEGSTGTGPPAEFEFTFWLPDGSECKAISPVTVVDGTDYTLPGADADCRTMPGALVGGWTIPVEPGFTGAGSSSLPFQPDHVVEVSGSQQFTVVPYEPVLVIELDANVDFVDTCVPTDVEHQSPDHMFRYKWVPRELISLARLPERASCEAPGYRLVGWNTEADGSGTTFELEGPIPDAWGTAPPNSHHLFGMWERIA